MYQFPDTIPSVLYQSPTIEDDSVLNLAELFLYIFVHRIMFVDTIASVKLDF